jgi:uncharacterized membrane protein YeaQ/YmgE (transglycosylase-associated protein family)
MVDLVIWLIVGAAAGWIAGIVVKGAGFGPLGNIIVGILGAIVAGFIFPLLGIAFLPGLIGDVIYAAIGAIILLLVVSWFRRAWTHRSALGVKFFLHTSCGSRRNVERRIRLARFPQTKSFDTFDFAAQPSLNKALVLELMRLASGSGSVRTALPSDHPEPEKRTPPWGWH